MGKNKARWFAVTFGFSLAIKLYLAYLAGAWLDNYFQIQPYSLLTTILLALLSSFLSLYRYYKNQEDNE